MDSQGRIILPISWRRERGDEVMVVEREDKLEIFPRNADLSKYMDSVEVANFSDYHEMRRELRGTK